MDRAQFEALRELPEKFLYEEIVFSGNKNTTPSLYCGPYDIHNSLDMELKLHGHYNPNIPSLTFNFSVKDTGPICRIDVNGTIHDAAGRTHRHELTTEDCPRLNLPDAYQCPEFNLDNMTPEEIWRTICEGANIVHVGAFTNP